MSDELVFLAEVGDNAEASILRAYLEDHGLFCYVQGENHRGLLGMVGAYISLRLMVPSDQLETARELLERYHEAEEEEPGPEFRGPFRDGGPEEDEEDDSLDEARLRQRIRKARLVALVLPCGFGHFAAGAPIRGLILMAICLGGFWNLFYGRPTLLLLWPLAVVMDWAGIPGAVRAKAPRQSERDSR